MPRTCLTLLSLLLIGCASSAHWVKKGATKRDFKRDSYECTVETRGTSVTVAVGTGIGVLAAVENARSAAEQESADLYQTCMEVRGWDWVEPKHGTCPIGDCLF